MSAQEEEPEVVDEGNLPVPYAFPLERAGPSVRNAQNALRMRQALEARAQGFEYYQIANELGCSVAAAQELVKRGLKATLREAADDVRKLELKRLDMLMQVYFDKAMQGHGPSVDRVLMMMERRARIEGIDAPIDHDQASLRNQFFQRLAAVMDHGEYVRVLRALSEMR